jgi:hypothetical protein
MTRVDLAGLAPALARRLGIAARVSVVLAPLSLRVTSARVALTDQNGPKGGPGVRCAITVGLVGRGRLHVEDQATTARLALAGALVRLEGRLEHRRERDRDARRRPKKYYAAARALRSASTVAP